MKAVDSHPSLEISMSGVSSRFEILIEKVPATAADWDLYESVKGAATAGKQLGDALKKALREAHERILKGADPRAEAVRVRDDMYRRMDKFIKVGARDTEPETILVMCIERVLELEDELGR